MIMAAKRSIQIESDVANAKKLQKKFERELLEQQDRMLAEKLAEEEEDDIRQALEEIKKIVRPSQCVAGTLMRAGHPG